MSEYVDVDIIENSKVIGTAKMYKGETKAEKGLEKRLGTMGYLNIQNVQKPYTDGFTDGMQEREKEIAELKHNKETVAHLADCLEEKMKERIEELEQQIEKMKCCYNCKSFKGYGETCEGWGEPVLNPNCDCTEWELRR